MPAASSCPIPVTLTKLGPVHQHDTGRLCAHLQRVPDPRSRRGRWYPLAGLLLICACAVVSGARTITEITEWVARHHRGAGTTRHPPPSARTSPGPSHATLTRLLAALDGDALDAAIGAWEVGAKTNETAVFRPLLEPLDLTGTVVTFDALHSVKEQVRWLVQEKNAHYLAVIKGNQPIASAQVKDLPWEQVPVAHTASGTGHGRRESRSVKTMAIAANLGGIAFPEARLALRIHRRRQESGKRQTRETVYAVTSLDTHQASGGTSPLTLADTCAGTGESKIPATMSEMWCSPRTPPRSTPAARRGRWTLCGTWP
ncbi:transposase family protein [Streptomyces mirabilis]|uniref:transposase family protein n=1 Tax=Streptomyces mirabilis TaxID=68239 RepID=UPI00332FF846